MKHIVHQSDHARSDDKICRLCEANNGWEIAWLRTTKNFQTDSFRFDGILSKVIRLYTCRHCVNGTNTEAVLVFSALETFLDHRTVESHCAYFSLRVSIKGRSTTTLLLDRSLVLRVGYRYGSALRRWGCLWKLSWFFFGMSVSQNTAGSRIDALQCDTEVSVFKIVEHFMKLTCITRPAGVAATIVVEPSVVLVSLWPRIGLVDETARCPDIIGAIKILTNQQA